MSRRSHCHRAILRSTPEAVESGRVLPAGPAAPEVRVRRGLVHAVAGVPGKDACSLAAISTAASTRSSTG